MKSNHAFILGISEILSHGGQFVCNQVLLIYLFRILRSNSYLFRITPFSSLNCLDTIRKTFNLQKLSYERPYLDTEAFQKTQEDTLITMFLNMFSIQIVFTDNFITKI